MTNAAPPSDNPKSLSELPFIDIYVRLDEEEQALYRSKLRGENKVSQLVPEVFAPAVDRMRHAIINSLKDHNDGTLNFEGIRCRLSRQKLSDNSVWACARLINTVIPKLSELGFMLPISNHMHELGLRDGLILVSGATGQGKTTTAVAMLADYLANYGGTAVTIEDPVEYLLKGRHGTGGHCFQVEVNQEEEWALNVKRALRWAPRYIYVGEVRTPKAAEQLLRAASTGHLVITTIHAGTLEEAIMGLIFLAEQAMGSGAHEMVSSCLTALINQTMRDLGPDVRYVYTESGNPGDPIRSLIRENKIGMMGTYIDRIMARLQNQPATTNLNAPNRTIKKP